MTTLTQNLNLGAAPRYTGPLIAGLGLLCLCFVGSLMVGAVPLKSTALWHALIAPSQDTASTVLYSARIPRTLLALLVGASLGVCGTLLQAITRNPLAAPTTMGINAGASVVILIVVMLYPNLPFHYFMPLAWLGGALAMTLVYLISLSHGFRPIHLAIAGITIEMLLRAGSQSLLTLFSDRAQFGLFAISGTCAAHHMHEIILTAPWMIAAILLTWRLHRPLALFALDDAQCQCLGLGHRPMLLLFSGLALLLAATAVSLSGPITFLGLLVPHFVKHTITRDYRWLIPFSALFGGIFLLLMDMAARSILPAGEVPINSLLALIGGPAFILLARKGWEAQDD